MAKKKNIVLGITGSIAAYKAVGLMRKLQNITNNLDIILTTNATRFVTPLTFEALLGKRIYTSMWDSDMKDPVPHITLSKADLIIVAPATANIIAKYAHGIADDLLSTTLLASTGKKLFVPAMHESMYLNPITQENIAVLKNDGISFLEPEIGSLASGDKGKGRFPETDKIIEAVKKLI